jgi:hypothetical protein
LTGALGLALLGNAFQFLWAQSADSVVRLSRAEYEALHDDLEAIYDGGSMAWICTLAEGPHVNVVEACNMMSLPAVLFGNHGRRTYYIVDK